MDWQKVKGMLWEGWKKELIWIIFFALLLFSIWGYKKDMEICYDVVENPCEYCYSQQRYEDYFKSQNITKLIVPDNWTINNLNNVT